MLQVLVRFTGKRSLMTETLDRPVLGTLDEAGRELLFTEARTANTWAGTPVTDEELTSIWELARWGPRPPGQVHGRREQGQDRGRARGRRARGGHPVPRAHPGRVPDAAADEGLLRGERGAAGEWRHA